MDNKFKELVADQQLEIQDLKNKLEQHESDKRCISAILVCIGGALNDNLLGYTVEQRQELRKINALAENGLEMCEC